MIKIYLIEYHILIRESIQHLPIYYIIIMHLLIILLCALSSSLGAKLLLQSSIVQSDSQLEVVQIPEIHEHPFSCELLFFNVHQDHFFVNISDLPGDVKQVQLTIHKVEDLVYQSKEIVNDKKAIFSVKTKPQDQSYEVIMNFNITYQIDNDIVIEQRKAYMLFCQKGQNNYFVRLPNATIAFTQAIGLALILILPWNIQYRKFLPFTYNLLTSFLYIVLLAIALYLQMFTKSQIVYDFQKYLIGVFELVCLLMYSQDLLMLCFQRNKVAFAIGLIFTLTLMGLDYFVGQVKDAWFLNDIIAIMVAGAFIKFVIIRKIKSAIWGLVLMWAFCIFRQFAKQFGIQKFDQGLGIRVVPLFLQMPTFFEGDNSSISCSAFGSSKIIAFGIILNYCKRVDLYLSTQFYRLLVSFVAVICIGGQLGFNIIFDDLPTIQVMSIILFYPLALSLILFFAKKRGEWAEIWDGSFYDMAVNRASIPRSVSFDSFQQQFGKDLMINSTTSQESRQEKDKNQK